MGGELAENEFGAH